MSRWPTQVLVHRRWCMLVSAMAMAQTFPSRPITIVVGYAAGGQADILARKVAQQLGENLKINRRGREPHRRQHADRQPIGRAGSGGRSHAPS